MFLGGAALSEVGGESIYTGPDFLPRSQRRPSLFRPFDETDVYHIGKTWSGSQETIRRFSFYREFPLRFDPPEKGMDVAGMRKRKPEKGWTSLGCAASQRRPSLFGLRPVGDRYTPFKTCTRWNPENRLSISSTF